MSCYWKNVWLGSENEQWMNRTNECKIVSFKAVGMDLRPRNKQQIKRTHSHSLIRSSLSQHVATYSSAFRVNFQTAVVCFVGFGCYCCCYCWCFCNSKKKTTMTTKSEKKSFINCRIRPNVQETACSSFFNFFFSIFFCFLPFRTSRLSLFAYCNVLHLLLHLQLCTRQVLLTACMTKGLAGAIMSFIPSFFFRWFSFLLLNLRYLTWLYYYGGATSQSHHVDVDDDDDDDSVISKGSPFNL